MASKGRRATPSSTAFYDELSQMASNAKKRELKLIVSTVMATSVILVLLINLFGINVDFTNSISSNNQSGTQGSTNSDQLYPSNNQSGQVVLTEAELRAEVAKISVPVYWVGPLSGAKYTLENQLNARVFVRYLPDGVLPPTGEATKRVIGTYKVANAFDTTKSASASVANSVGVTGANGEAIFYVQSNAKNVYVAFPGVDAQIEIYDPEPGASLKLATQKGLLQVIR